MGVLSTHYDGSFGGTGFMELYENGLEATEPDTAGVVSKTHVPGGNTTVIQTAGLIAQELDLKVGVDAAQLAALRSKVLTRATLVYHAGSVSARLIRVKNVIAVGNSGSGTAMLELVIG